MSATLTALLFPGQGSQTPGMREEVERHRPELLEAATDAVGADPFERVEEGTRYAQPAIYCTSLASWSRLGEPLGDLLAGHSLGEYAALVAAGSLDPHDGLRLVALRGRLMQEAGERDSGRGGMLAVLGSGAVSPAQLADRHGLFVANDNAPGQVVLSGPAGALEPAAADAEAAGLRAIRLPVTGAFHSPAMAGGVPAFEAALAEVELSPPRAPVFSGVTAAPFDDLRRRLAEGLTHGVRWRETLLALRARGARRLVEVGPGRVLTGLVRRTLDDVEAVTAGRLEPAHA